MPDSYKDRPINHINLTTLLEGSVLYKSLVGYRNEMIRCLVEVRGFQILKTVVSFDVFTAMTMKKVVFWV
jgi:hypothetical protein